jgi:hypothetical protein
LPGRPTPAARPRMAGAAGSHQRRPRRRWVLRRPGTPWRRAAPVLRDPGRDNSESAARFPAPREAPSPRGRQPGGASLCRAGHWRRSWGGSTCAQRSANVLRGAPGCQGTHRHRCVCDSSNVHGVGEAGSSRQALGGCPRPRHHRKWSRTRRLPLISVESGPLVWRIGATRDADLTPSVC